MEVPSGAAPARGGSPAARAEGGTAQRLTVIQVARSGLPATTLGEEVRTGLAGAARHLPCRFFYDREGSLLFEEICALPEYYLTRAESEILDRHSDDIAARFHSSAVLVELGSGSARKTRHLIQAFSRRQRRVVYVPIDISREVLMESSRVMLAEQPGLEIIAINGEYEPGVAELDAALDRHRELDARLVLWLGSSIGNLRRDDASRFLRTVASGFSSRDRLLVGIDLRKERSLLEAAYDDAGGVTALFNVNLLARINRELDGNFDLAAFRHRAIYDDEGGKIDMFLESVRDQEVRIRRLDLSVRLRAGERIHTESCYKYSLPEIDELAARARLVVEKRWLDSERRFSVNLLALPPAEPDAPERASREDTGTL